MQGKAIEFGPQSRRPKALILWDQMEDFLDAGGGLWAIESLPSNGCGLKQLQHAFLVFALRRGEDSVVGEKALLFKVAQDTRMDPSDKKFDVILRDVSGVVKAGTHES